MKKIVLLLATIATLTLLGCSDPKNGTDTAARGKSEAMAMQAENKAYFSMADSFFKAKLKLDPIEATIVGVNQYNDRFGGALTGEYLQQRHLLNSDFLDRARDIRRERLSPTLQLSYDTFIYDRKMALALENYPAYFMPMNQFHSTLITMVQFGSGEGAQPFKTVKDYKNWLSRLKGFIHWIKLAKTRMNEGIENKVTLPRVLVERIIHQLDTQLVAKPQESIFYTPIKHLPKTFTRQDKQLLTGQYTRLINDSLIPSLRQLRQYFQQVYLPAARSTDGWWGLPNGKAWYQHLANSYTTTTMPVGEIYRLGLTEVARIKSQLDSVRKQVGFKGDLKAFFATLSSDPRYFFDDRQSLIDGYKELKTKINLKLPSYFGVIPKADYVIKPVEHFREQSAAGVSYKAPAIDGSRPGIFYINTYNLKAQPKWDMTSLFLHEVVPGHHFQVAIEQQLTGIPAFQRFSDYAAFDEGWGLYAESLGNEMGLLDDPYQNIGKLSDEMLMAMRLVVDTGLHAKGWSRQQAIEYMKNNSPMAESDIVAEVERYMAVPGQALSYKTGQLKILELRAEAEKALGEQFDLRAFHDQVLNSGSLPMDVLELKIHWWITKQKQKMNN